jgi:osmoprotectant transport system permease protein
MGYDLGRMLWRVELPIAMPAMMAGVRIATVSSATAGLEQIISRFNDLYRAEVVTGSALCAALALVAKLR